MKITLEKNQVWKSIELDGLQLKIIGFFEMFSSKNKIDKRVVCIKNNTEEVIYKEISLKSFIKKNNLQLI